MNPAGPKPRSPHSPGLLLAAVFAALPAAAIAQTAPADAPTLGGSLGFVTDYRFRGISNSDQAPAVQASLQLDTPSGVFLGVWGSSIADLQGAPAEIDLSAGWAGAVGAFDMSVGIIGYLFPGGQGNDVVELFGAASFALGPATATLGLNWAPEQANLERASRYVHATVSTALPGRPLRLRASMGHETGGLPLRRSAAPADKWDWQLGADITLPDLTIGVAYVGTDLPTRDSSGVRVNRLGSDGILLKLTAFF